MHPDEWADFIKVDDDSLNEARLWINEYCLYLEAKNIGQIIELSTKQIRVFNIINDKLNNLRAKKDGK